MAKYLNETGVAYLVNKILDLLDLKVNVEEGKGLSEEDFTTSLKNKLNELENYSLPTASSENLGGVKVGAGLEINPNTGELSVLGEEEAAARASQSAIVAGNYAA